MNKDLKTNKQNSFHSRCDENSIWRKCSVAPPIVCPLNHRSVILDSVNVKIAAQIIYI